MPFDATPPEAPAKHLTDEVVELLQKGIARISDPDHWGKHMMYSCGKWCAVGSIMPDQTALNFTDAQRAAISLLNNLAFAKGFETIMAFNDSWSTTHKDVLDLMKHAAARAKRGML